MSYLTSNFITVLPSFANNLNFLSQTVDPFLNTKKKKKKNQGFSNSKQLTPLGLKKKRKNSSSKTKTTPLMLFVNLLMKDGKKTKALRLLSTTLSLFKARISKIKLERKKKGCLKKGYQPLYFYLFFNPFTATWVPTCPKNFISNYSVETWSFYAHFSSKTGSLEKKENSFFLLPERSCTASQCSRLDQRKVYPFISDFDFVVDQFYTQKRFFCGKFLNLRPFQAIKNPLFSCASVFFFGDNFSTPFGLKKEKKTFDLTSFSKQSSKIACLRKKTPCRNSEKCFWYKIAAKKPCWNKLTNNQKNTFLICLYKALSNVKPPLECRTKRIGGSNKQIPSQVSEHRQWGIAIRWIIEAAQNDFSKKKKKENQHKPVYRPYSENNTQTSGNVQETSKQPRGLGLLAPYTVPAVQSKVYHSKHIWVASNKDFSWLIEEKNKFKDALVQRKLQAESYSLKTKCDSFCFFLAESLENAYYKRGPAMHKRNLWVETALANRAFLRYRWW